MSYSGFILIGSECDSVRKIFITSHPNRGQRRIKWKNNCQSTTIFFLIPNFRTYIEGSLDKEDSANSFHMTERIVSQKGDNTCSVPSGGLRKNSRHGPYCLGLSNKGSSSSANCWNLLLLWMIMVLLQVGGCDGLLSRSTAESNAKISPIVTSAASFTNRDTTADIPRQNDQIYRRNFLSQALSSLSGGVLLVSTLGLPKTARAESEEVTLQPSRIIRLSSGLQFSDQRIGSGPLVPIPKAIGGSSTTNRNNNQNSIDNKDDLEPDDPSIVLMHLKALKQDGSVLLDTFEEGKPLLFRLGSVPSEMYYLNEAGAMAKGKIPLGVQDAILAQGAASWEGGFGKADPMRTGGIRKVVLPSELAYGAKGVSRYEALKLGLKQPVARNELLRYEIELLRCNDEVMDLAGSEASMIKDDGTKSNAVAARACCLQESYPCKMNGG